MRSRRRSGSWRALAALALSGWCFAGLGVGGRVALFGFDGVGILQKRIEIGECNDQTSISNDCELSTGALLLQIKQSIS